MKLITAAIQKKLEDNYIKACETGETQNVELKLFGGSACTWLITEMDTEHGILSGLCDIGMGCCEFGSVSLKELQEVRFPPCNLPIERDRHFDGGSVESFREYYNTHGSLNGC